MTRKNMGSRLADSLRQARQAGQPAQPAQHGETSIAKAPEVATSQAADAKQERTSNTVAQQLAMPIARGVMPNSEQAPAPNLDRPWDNLHPDRIWPD